MAKRVSNDDRVKIKNKLQEACEKSWRLNGYKKTNIPSLTKNVGISSGAFYLIYKNKEELFLDVLENVQVQLLEQWSQILNESDNKLEGFKKALQWLFEEYRSSPNLSEYCGQMNPLVRRMGSSANSRF